MLINYPGKSETVPQIKLNGVVLERLQQYEYFRLTIHESLNLESHIRKLIRNTQHKVYIFGRIRKFLSVKLLVLVTLHT